MKNKKSTPVALPALIALLLAVASPSSYGMAPGTASYQEPTQMAAGIDILGELPVGNFADVTGFGFGALGRYEYNLDESPLAVTLRAGYVWHLEKENGPVTTNYAEIPLLVGLKYSLAGAPIYIAGEVGAVTSMIDTEGGFGGSTSDSETNLGLTAGVGYEMGPVDVRVGLNFLDASNMADAMAIGVSFGYNFWGK
jgi:hypothetical protein